MKNKCKFSEKLYMYLEGQLDEQQKDKVLEHMKICNSCREEYEILASIQSEFKGFEEIELPKDYHQKLHMKLVQALNQENKEEKKNFVNIMNKLLPITAVALVLIVTVKGASMFISPMLEKNETLASTAGAQMDNMSTDTANLKVEGLSGMQEQYKTMNTAEDSVKDNKVMAKEMQESKAVGMREAEKLDALSTSAIMASQIDNTPKAKSINPKDVASNQNNYASELQNIKPTSIAFETLFLSDMSNIDKPQNIIIQSQDKFKGLWEQMNKNDKLPEIDFEKYTVIAVFMGERSTGGYSIKITNIVENEKNIVVTINESDPDGDIAADVMTSPFHIVKIMKTNKEIVFNK